MLKDIYKVHEGYFKSGKKFGLRTFCHSKLIIHETVPSFKSSLESELRAVSGGDAAENGPGDVEEREVEVQVGADVHRHHSVESAEERGRLRVHQDDAHLFISQF